MLKTIKIPTIVPTCFGSRRNHHHVIAYLHNRLVCRHNIDHVIDDARNRIIILILAKHEIAPWWWLLREPKHVGTIVGILIVFNIPMIL